MSLPKITDATFDDITSKDTVLVKATAKWCSPCQVMNPVLDDSRMFRKRWKAKLQCTILT